MPSSAPITIEGPSSAGTLTFRSMTGFEALARCFEYQIDVLSTKSDIGASDLLGAPVAVELETKNFQIRYFHGIVAAMEYRGFDGSQAQCRLLVRPWFWFLTRAKNSRIFQNKSVVDVIKEVFDQYNLAGAADFTELQGNYPSREYIVQYDETDFNFVSRLMENEGIYYFFRHSEGAHTMVLVDTYTTHVPAPDYKEIPFAGPDTHRDALLEYVSDWNVVHEAQPGTYSQRDFDFKNPASLLMSSRSIDKGYQLDNFEVYEYPGGFLTTSVGDDYSRVRLEALQTGFEQASATSNARGLAVGNTFKLIDHPRDDQNQDYVVISAEYRLRGHEGTTSPLPEDEPFVCTFVAMDPTAPFRPEKIAGRPRMCGPQTALVVGPDGKEIWVDEYGRVQVQFHWDRKGEYNEKSSCFVRVSQVWAGSGWGAVFTPRIGQEVIVDFLDGDPDRPIIVGRVYNGSNMPPYEPKTHPTRSGIRSHSSAKGSLANFNEIRFEDLKGHEELYIQAEKTQTTLVKGSQSISVGGDRSVSVSGNEQYVVKKKRATEITGDESIKVTDGDVTHLFQHNQTLDVGDTYSATVEKDYTVTTSQGQIKLTHADAHFKIDPGSDMEMGNKAGALVSLANGGAVLISATSANITIQRGETQILITDSLVQITSKSAVKIEAGDSVSVSAGKGAATMDLGSAGVTVTGMQIKLNA
jgi:type VI secretion system secreted protein VgrG